MEDRELLHRALRLQAPWFVRGVKLDRQGMKVEIVVNQEGW